MRGRERLRDEAAEPAMVVAVLRQEVGVHAVVAGKRARRLELRELLGSQRQRRIEDEPLVVLKHGDDIVIEGHEPDRRLSVEPGLAEHGIALAHARIRLVGRLAEVARVKVVLLRRRHRTAHDVRSCSSSSPSNTTEPGSAAGRASPASGRSRGSCARRSPPSTRASTGSRSPAAPTPASMRPARSRASTSTAGRRRSAPRRR